MNHRRHRITICDYCLYCKLLISMYRNRIRRPNYRYIPWRNSYRRNSVKQRRTHDGRWPTARSMNCVLFGAFAKLWKATIGFVTSLCLSSARPSFCLSVRPSGTTGIPVEGVSWKFYIWEFFEYPSRNFQFSLNSDKNNRGFTGRYIYIYENISLNSSCNKKYFRRVL